MASHALLKRFGEGNVASLHEGRGRKERGGGDICLPCSQRKAVMVNGREGGGDDLLQAGWSLPPHHHHHHVHWMMVQGNQGLFG